MSAVSFDNLAVWIAQVFLITTAGAILPVVFRIHHPRSNLPYYRLLLVVAFILPLLQPLHHEVVPVTAAPGTSISSVPQQTAAAVAPASVQGSLFADWRNILLVVLVAGIIVRIGWLAGGLWQLRRLRKSSTLLAALPRAVQAAREITEAAAEFRISPTIKGPVTFGFFRPVILLPQSFLDMPDEAQSIVACHELLHVRRYDWLMTITEELLAAVLWFQPAVWWLVAQSQLAREQLVDAAVVSQMASRESYLETLFSLADARWEADLGVAQLFLRKRHLIHRVHSLLTEVEMSKTRLLSSYFSIVAILGIGGVLMFVALPLTGEAEIRYVAGPQPPPAVQNSPGYVVNRSPISYPVEARQKRIEGTVVVEVTFGPQGRVVDARVLSGPDELRQAALQTALQGLYDIDVARTLQVVVDFKLPAAPAPATTPGTLFAEVTGTVVDRSSGQALPGVTVTVANAQDGTGRAAVTTTNEKGEYHFQNVSPGTYRFTAQLPGFQTSAFNSVLLGRSMQARLNFALESGAGTVSVGQTTGARGGARGGAPLPPPPPPAPGSAVRVGKNIAAANLITRVPPVYPAKAKEAQIQGVVDLEANINKEGQVVSLTVLTGHELLTQAAIDAVQQWVYRPVLLNGQPVDIVTVISVNFP